MVRVVASSLSIPSSPVDTGALAILNSTRGSAQLTKYLSQAINTNRGHRRRNRDIPILYRENILNGSIKPSSALGISITKGAFHTKKAKQSIENEKSKKKN
jgi:hypothetical protein